MIFIITIKRNLYTQLYNFPMIVYLFDLVYVLTQKEIKVRYKNSVFGYFWSVMHPLAFALMFYLAFKVFMKVRLEDYPLFLITGLFPWQWFSNSVSSSLFVLMDNASLIKKLNFPRELIPLSSVINHSLHFLLSLPVILLFMYFYDKSPSLWFVLYLICLFLPQFMINYGVSLMVSSLHLFFRDLDRLVSILLTLLFYLTPVIYSEDMIPHNYRYILYLNPMSGLLINWRRLFLDEPLDIHFMLLSYFYAFVIFLLGYALFKKLSWKFAEVL